MVVEYRYNPKLSLNLIYRLKWYYLQYFLLVTFLILISIYNNIPINALLAAISFFSIPLVLQLILHLDYYFNDKDSLLTIDYKNKIIELTNNSGTTTIAFDDIKEIIYLKGGISEEKWGRYVIPSNLYHHTVIKNNNGAKIIFTDFILRDFNLAKIKKRIATRALLNLT